MSETQDSEDDVQATATQQEERPAPKFDRWINEIPDVEPGDKVRVETDGDYAPDRTLTVEEVGVDCAPSGLMERQWDDEACLLSGYGTEYEMFVTGTKHWLAVDIRCPSMDHGERVSNIEVTRTGERR